MKKHFLTMVLSVATVLASAQTATNFNCNDCSNVPHRARLGNALWRMHRAILDHVQCGGELSIIQPGQGEDVSLR